MNTPSILFVALAEYDLSRLTTHGLSDQGDEVVLLHEDAEAAREAVAPALVRCLLMIQAERMTAEGHEFESAGAGIWRIAAVPPQYLWISESDSSSEITN